MSSFEIQSLSSNVAFAHLDFVWDFANSDWPTLEELSEECFVRFVVPHERKMDFSSHYEVRIVERKEVETRDQCAHDFVTRSFGGHTPRASGL